MSNVESGGMEMVGQGVLGILIFPCAAEFGYPIEHIEVEAEDFCDFASGGLATIGDDVGSHRRAKFSITVVDVLNGAFALIAAGKIEIDVRPLAAFFGEKSLEQQLHLDRIH